MGESYSHFAGLPEHKTVPSFVGDTKQPSGKTPRPAPPRPRDLRASLQALSLSRRQSQLTPSLAGVQAGGRQAGRGRQRQALIIAPDATSLAVSLGTPHAPSSPCVATASEPLRSNISVRRPSCAPPLVGAAAPRHDGSNLGLNSSFVKDSADGPLFSQRYSSYSTAAPPGSARRRTRRALGSSLNRPVCINLWAALRYVEMKFSFD
ncbi:unnamed protein product [Chrysodeixis includens]|uniref:Uncharacterized protein n=1 Tax=Chrysodeixis includens TaxID=689277 RepID=A0A9N8KZ09_CHRIL|nr:unnamed protein product [Chrysodeixis includens]